MLTVIAFSGGLDSVALGILLAREGHELEPVYLSHRHGGNVTRKEADVASTLAPFVCDRELVVVKAPTKDETWWEEISGQIVHTDDLPIPKKRKNKRNAIFLGVLRDTGILLDAKHVALGVLGESSVSARLRDVTHEDLEYDLDLDPGFLITPASLGYTGKAGKAEMLKAIGRSSTDRKLCYSSESCLMYFNTHCGNCGSCKERVQAFMEAWGKDSTPYRKDTFCWKHKRGKA